MAGQANVEVLVEAVTEAAESSLNEVSGSLEETGDAGADAADGMADAEDAADGAGSSMATAADDAENLSDASYDTADGLFEIDAAAAAASGGLAAAGTAMQALFDKTQSTRESLGRTAATLGMTRDEVSGMATDLSNATFPLEDAEATLSSLAQQGVESEEDLRNVADSMDAVADATGSSAESISDSMGPALRAFGNDLENAEEHMDTFTFVARNTTQDVEGFSSVVERLAPELQEMGLSLDETAAIMAALEEKGITGRQAIREFRQATREAEGDQAALREELGLSGEAIAEQEQALSEAEGTTREHAEAANESLTATDSLRAKFDDLMLQASETLGPVNALAPALQGVGTAGLALSAVNTSAVIPSITGVVSALGPILPILAAVAAAVAALYVAWENNLGGIRDKAQELWELLQPLFQDIQDVIRQFVQVATDLWNQFGDEIMAVVDAVFGTILNIIMVQLDAVISAIRVVLNIIQGDWEEAWNIVKNFFGRTLGRIQQLLTGWADAFAAILGGLGQTIAGFANTTKQILLSAVQAYIGFWRTLGETLLEIGQRIFDFLTNIFTSLKERLFGLGNQIREGITNRWNQLKEMVLTIGQTLFDRTVGRWLNLMQRLFDLGTQVKQGIIQRWQAMKERVVSIGQALYDATVGKITNLKNRLFELGNRIKNGITQRWNTLQNQVQNKTQMLYDKTVGKITNLKEKILSLGDNIRDGLKERFTQMKDRVQEQVQQVKEKVIQKFKNIKERLFGIGENIREFFQNLWADLKASVPDGDDLVPDVPDVDVPGSDMAGDAAGAVGGAASRLPGLAEGGRVAETGLALVHEGETFIPDEVLDQANQNQDQQQPTRTAPETVEQRTEVNVDVAGSLDNDPYQFSRDLATQVQKEMRNLTGT